MPCLYRTSDGEDFGPSSTWGQRRERMLSRRADSGGGTGQWTLCGQVQVGRSRRDAEVKQRYCFTLGHGRLSAQQFSAER